MKQFTGQFVSRWVKKPELITHARGAKPFPGKAPTRIVLSAVVGNRRFYYIGKPSRTLFNAYIKFCKVPIKNFESVFIYMEFDKGGAVHLDLCYPGGWNPGTRKTNLKLWQYYHSEVMAENYPNWLKWPYVVKEHVYKIA